MLRSRFLVASLFVALAACSEPVGPTTLGGYVAVDPPALEQLDGVVERSSNAAAPRLALRQDHRVLLLAGKLEGLDHLIGSPVRVEGRFMSDTEFNVVSYKIIKAVE